MALSYLEVIGVMGRSNLYAAGSKPPYLRIHLQITGISRSVKGSFNILPTISLYRSSSGIDSHSRIAKERLRTGGCNLNKAARLSHYGVVDVPEEAVLFYVLYLRVGDRGLAYRTPVDDAGTLVDVSFS